MPTSSGCTPAVSELLETERAYLEDLNALSESYFAGLSELLDENEVAMLFGPLKEIQDLHRDFYSHLSEQIRVIGVCFTRFFEKFKVYCAYCVNLSYSNRVLEVLRRNPAVAEKLLELKLQSRCKLGIDADLLKPYQRVLRYPLLLQAILDHDPASKEIARALECMKYLAAHINRTKSTSETVEAMLTIQIDSLPTPSLLDYGLLVYAGTGSNAVVRFGRITNHLNPTAPSSFSNLKERYVFLCEKALIVAKLKKISQTGSASSQHQSPAYVYVSHFMVDKISPEVRCYPERNLLEIFCEDKHKKHVYALVPHKSSADLPTWSAQISKVCQDSLVNFIRAKNLLPEIQTMPDLDLSALQRSIAYLNLKAAQSPPPASSLGKPGPADQPPLTSIAAKLLRRPSKITSAAVSRPLSAIDIVFPDSTISRNIASEPPKPLEPSSPTVPSSFDKPVNSGSGFPSDRRHTLNLLERLEEDCLLKAPVAPPARRMSAVTSLTHDAALKAASTSRPVIPPRPSYATR